jgi:hypothetical protein
MGGAALLPKFNQVEGRAKEIVPSAATAPAKPAAAAAAAKPK